MKKCSVLVSAIVFLTVGQAFAVQDCGQFSDGDKVTIIAPKVDDETFNVVGMYAPSGELLRDKLQTSVFTWQFGSKGDACPASDKLPLGFSLKFANEHGDVAVGMLQIDLLNLKPGTSISPTLKRSKQGSYCLQVNNLKGVKIIYDRDGKKDCP